jgi:hypothetical protein
MVGSVERPVRHGIERGLRCESLDCPLISIAAVATSIVEPVVPFLPELHQFGPNAIRTPAIRAWNIFAIASPQFSCIALDHSQVRDHPTLVRCGTCRPCCGSASGPVSISFDITNSGDRACDAHLTMDGTLPVQNHGHTPVTGEVNAFVALAVGKEDGCRSQFSQHDHPHGGTAIGPSCSESHSLWQ